MCMPNAPWPSRPSLSPSPITALRLAASPMTGAKRRALEAERTRQYGDGHPLMAEAVLGWGRQTVALGLAERRTGSRGLGAPAAGSGRKRWDEHHPQAAQALHHLADAQAPQDPTLRTRVTSTRLTAQAAGKAWREAGESEEQWPSPRTMAAVRKRLGFRWRRVVQATPQKHIKETEALCDHMKKKRRTPCHRRASNDGVSLGKRP
jgi:hypothetical protein